MLAYADEWDRPHRAPDHPQWQESDCYWFWDTRTQVGGFHRIGQRPAAGEGHVMLYVFEVGALRYRRVEAFGSDELERTENGQRVVGSTVQAVGGGVMHFGWSETETEASLRFEECFYPPRDWSRSGHGAKVGDLLNAAGHLECSGRMRGRLRIGKREHEIDALAHRDRSWGVRDVSKVAQHRMCSGTVGSELSWATFGLHLKGAGFHVSGFVVRDGIEMDVRSLRIPTTLADDGVTVLGGVARLELEDGSRLAIPCRALQGFVAVTGGGYLSTDTLCAVENDGHEGFCDLEVANNPTWGSHVPEASEIELACFETGLSPSRDYRG